MRSLIFILVLLFAVPAFAEEAKGTLVSLSAEAEQWLPNNEVVVRFRIEAEGPKVDVLRKRVNSISKLVSEKLGSEKGVFQATTGRQIEPVWKYDNALHRQVRNGWRLVQSAQATSIRLDDVPEWVDAIEQAGAHLDSLDYRVSQGSANASRNRLRIRAIAEFRARAVTIAKALGASSFRILRLNSNSIIPRLAQPMMAMAKATKKIAPVFEPGRSRIKVRVSGEILLPERDYSVK